MHTRRSILIGAAASWVTRSWARPDAPRGPYPLYLEGEVTVINWADPRPHLEMIHSGITALPPDLARRSIPRQKDPVDIPAMLAQAALPVRRGLWYVALPSLARLYIWNVPRPRIKQVIAVVGYPLDPVTGTPALRAEVLFIDGRGFPMRSDPT